MANTSLNNASISMANAIGISNTIASNAGSISSLNISNTRSFTNTITSPVSSTIQDPVKTVLSKALSNIATTSNLADKKITDLQATLNSYVNKNSLVKISGNNIVISVSSQNQVQGQVEQANIQSQINSIKSTLGILQKSVGTLSNITSTVKVLLTSVTLMESLMTINPVTKATFTVFKQAIKVVFLKDMLSSYLTLISTQLAQNTSQLNEMTGKFMNLQVSLNIQDNSNQGNNITPTQAVNNINQGTNGSQSYNTADGKTYILSVNKQSDGQLVGKAIDSITGQLAAQTASSFISSSDDLINELKEIINV